MDHQSMRLCEEFAGKWLDPKVPLAIGDVGSKDVNGSYRSLFAFPKWIYVGMDIEPGPNVDIVLPNEYEWDFPSLQFDVIISGQVLEHVRKPWKWIHSLASILKPNGIIFISAPNTFQFHPYPFDCWRIWPEGVRALFEEANIKEEDIFAEDYLTVGVGRKAA